MDLAHLDATAQADRVRSGEVSPTELVDAAIERIEKVDPLLNSIIHRRFERAREEARAVATASGPFAGVPLVLKDAGCQQAGEPHHMGMRVLRDCDHRETEDSWLTRRFRDAGFVVVGRANTPEMASMPTTEPLAYGPTRNPWSLEHSTGGSSGGSAAAVAAGLVPVAHASDGGGSIRMPAGCCGLVGLKPSRGRITRGPHDGEGWGGLSTDGVVTRTVRDTAAVMDCIAGSAPGDPNPAPPLTVRLADVVRAALEADAPRSPLRIGVRTAAFADGDPTHPDCLAAVETAGAALTNLGHEVSTGGPTALDDPEIPGQQAVVVGSSSAVALEAWGRRIGREIGLDELEPANARVIEAARARSANDYARAVAALHAYTRRVVPWWESRDLLLTPTLTDPTPRLGEMRGDLPTEALMALRPRLGWLVPPFNITGQPAISLPAYVNGAGLPIGVQLVAAPGREDVLVEVAAQLERALQWSSRTAPTHA